MKNDVKININITFSKALSVAILLLGFVYAYVYHDATVLITAMSTASAVISIKNMTDKSQKSETSTEKEN